jgi:hypothetical protein
MDKDIALVSATDDDYHDGLREKANKPANESRPSGTATTQGFQVSSMSSCYSIAAF